jgi:hypothetical protein
VLSAFSPRKKVLFKYNFVRKFKNSPTAPEVLDEGGGSKRKREKCLEG